MTLKEKCIIKLKVEIAKLSGVKTIAIVMSANIALLELSENFISNQNSNFDFLLISGRQRRAFSERLNAYSKR